MYREVKDPLNFKSNHQCCQILNQLALPAFMMHKFSLPKP